MLPRRPRPPVMARSGSSPGRALLRRGTGSALEMVRPVEQERRRHCLRRSTLSRLDRMSPAARHKAQQPANGCDDEEDDAYPQKPAQCFGKAAYQEKNNCYYTSNDQKCIHGQHIPFWGNL